MLDKGQENLRNIIEQIEDRYKALRGQAQNTSILVGITGPSGAGKSTISTYLKEVLLENTPQRTVTVIPTDNFIYPNSYLEQHNLMAKKGFPESFDLGNLKKLLVSLKNRDKEIHITPVYSHDLKDIHPHKKECIEKSDIYLIEGVNLLFRLESKNEFSIRPLDYVDLCIYLDINLGVIKQRSIKRFYDAYENAKRVPSSYFYPLMSFSETKLHEHIENLWDQIDIPLLQTHVEPYKHLAHIVIDELPEIYT